MTLAWPDKSKIGIFFKDSENHFWTSVELLQRPVMSASLNVSHMKNANVRNLFDVILTDMDIDAPGVQKLSSIELESIKSRLMNTPIDFHPSSSRITLTSGTTGKPKAAVIAGKTLIQRINILRDTFSINQDTCLWSLMGLDTIGGFTFPVATLSSGGSVHWINADDTKFTKFKANFAKVNLVVAAPNRITAVLKARNQNWPNKESRMLITGGSQIHPKARDLALQTFCSKVINLYGSTEAGMVAYADARFLDQHADLAGKTMPFHRVEIVDEHKHPLPVGQVGEVRISSNLLASGYLENGAIVPFEGNYYYPGDLGAINSQGYLFITGRCDDVINLGGVKFNAAEFEKKIKAIDSIADCCMFTHIKDDVQRIALLVETDEKDMTLLKLKIKEQTGFNKNFSIVKVAEIPRNPMGKIPRKALSMWFEEQTLPERV